MKPLLPTLKERQRYIVYELISANAVGIDLSDALLQRLTEILGVFGAADAGILSVSYDTNSQSGILRVNHDQVHRVRAALVMVTHLGRTHVLVRTLGVSGILRKAQQFLPQSAQKQERTHAKGVKSH